VREPRPNEPRPKRRQRGRRPTASRRADLWREVPALEDPAPIIPASDPTAVLRSLGTPPLPSHDALADYYLATVITRAARVATALAATAGLLSDHHEE